MCIEEIYNNMVYNIHTYICLYIAIDHKIYVYHIYIYHIYIYVCVIYIYVYVYIIIYI